MTQSAPTNAHDDIALLGAWHLGAVAAASFTRWGRQVRIWEPDPEIRAGLAEGRPAVAEPGLAKALLEGTERLTVVGSPDEAIAGSGIVFVSYDAPVSAEGRLDITPILEAVEQAAVYAPHGALVLVHSQVPIGTGAELERCLLLHSREDLLLAETPENLRLGTALENFTSPGFMTVGASSDAAAAAAVDFWRDTGAQIATCDLATAELSKHVINTALAAATALGNEIASAAYVAGADPTIAAALAKRDARIANLPLMPGMPFGGGNLGRDVRILAELLGPDSLAAAVENANKRRIDVLAERIRAESSKGEVAILGLTYKPNTSSLRFSMALELAGRLIRQGRSVRAFDPQVALDDPLLSSQPDLVVCPDLDRALSGASTAVICLNLPAFGQLDGRRLLQAGIDTIHDLAGALDRSEPWEPIRLLGP